MTPIIAILIRLPMSEIERLRDHPDILPKYDPRVALQDGRGLDLGRAWEELGCFIDGGVNVPSSGPTVGEEPLPNTDERAVWSYVEPTRVARIAEQLRAIRREDFDKAYEVDTEETADSFPGGQTGEWGERGLYLRNKLEALAAHYAAAAANAEAMLVRIGARM